MLCWAFCRESYPILTFVPCSVQYLHVSCSFLSYSIFPPVMSGNVREESRNTITITFFSAFPIESFTGLTNSFLNSLPRPRSRHRPLFFLALSKRPTPITRPLDPLLLFISLLLCRLRIVLHQPQWPRFIPRKRPPFFLLFASRRTILCTRGCTHFSGMRIPTYA